MNIKSISNPIRLCLIFLLTLSTHILFSQNAEIIPNPPNHDTNNVGFHHSTFEYNNKLYLQYLDNNNKFQLYEFDGTNLNLIQCPPEDSISDYYGSPFIYNGKLYLRFRNNSGVSYMYEFDGTNLVQIPNPVLCTKNSTGYGGFPFEFKGKIYLNFSDDNDDYLLTVFDGDKYEIVPDAPEFTTPFRGFAGIQTEFNDKLYIRYHNNEGVYVIYEYDGQFFKLIPNPPNHSNNSVGFFPVNVVSYKGGLYIGYRNNSFLTELYKYQDDTLTLIPNPPSHSNSHVGYRGDGFVFNDKLYIRYLNNSNVYRLYEYDGDTLQLVPNAPNTSAIASGFLGRHFYFNNKLYLWYGNNQGINSNYIFDGTNFTLVPNPPNNTRTHSQVGYDGAGIEFNGKRYMKYKNNDLVFVLYEFDGDSFVLYNNPPNHTENLSGMVSNGLTNYKGKLYARFRDNNNVFHMGVYCPLSYSTIFVENCGEYESPSGSFVWNTSGLYQDKVPNNNGCDSNITINLNILEPPLPIISQNGHVLTTDSFESYQWSLNGVQIAGATNRSHLATEDGLYTVNVIANNNCSGASSEFEFSTLGLSQKNTSPILIYPNPTSQKFNIKYMGKNRIEVYSSSGKIMCEMEFTNDLEIDVSEYPSSLYFLRVINENGDVSILKLIKE